MSDDRKERPRHFEPVESAIEAKAFLTEGIKTLASTIIWTRNQEFNFNTYISGEDDFRGRIFTWIPKDFDVAKFKSELDKKNDHECYFSMSLVSANIFFKTQFLSADRDKMIFNKPTQIFKVQRRADYRLPIPEGFHVMVSFFDPANPDHRTQKKILDISGGGIAVQIAPDELSIYKLGIILKGLEFRVKNRLMKTNAEVRYSKAPQAGQKNKHPRIGLKFTDLPLADAQFIRAYVLEESRKHFSRFM